MLFQSYFMSAMVAITAGQPILMTKPHTLQLAVTLPITGNIYPLGQVGLEPVRMIAEIVNNRSDILPDYNVVIDVIDDQCDAAVGLNRTVGPFFLQEQAIFNSTNRIGQFQFPENFKIQQETANSFLVPPLIAGPVCSAVCIALATLMPTFNTIHVCSNISLHLKGLIEKFVSIS